MLSLFGMHSKEAVSGELDVSCPLEVGLPTSLILSMLHLANFALVKGHLPNLYWLMHLNCRPEPVWCAASSFCVADFGGFLALDFSPGQSSSSALKSEPFSLSYCLPHSLKCRSRMQDFSCSIQPLLYSQIQYNHITRWSMEREGE